MIPNAIELLVQTPWIKLLGDVLVIAHVLAIVIGLSTVIKTDTAMLARLHKPFRQRDLVRLYQAHGRIGLALITLWVTGLGLFLIRTGGDPSLASPKLVAKLVTVSWLSLTALAMSQYGLWALGRCVGRPLLDTPLVPRLLLAVCAGMSVAGWGTALLLGGASTLLAAEWDALREVLLLTHAGAVGCALCAAAVVPVFKRRTQPALDGAAPLRSEAEPRNRTITKLGLADRGAKAA